MDLLGTSEKPIAETVTDDPKKLIGRTVSVPMSDISPKFIIRSHVMVTFQITEVQGNNAKTRFKGHYYKSDYLRFLVKRRSTRIDSISNVRTKDGVPLRISVSAFTYRRILTSQKKGVSRLILDIVKEESEKYTFHRFVEHFLTGELAKKIRNEASKKIVPLKQVEVHKSKVLIPLDAYLKQMQAAATAQ